MGSRFVLSEDFPNSAENAYPICKSRKMKILKMKSRMAVALIACAGAFAYADDAPEEELVAFGESGLWLGPDEIVVAAGELGLWLGPDEIVVAAGESGLWLGPDEILMAEDEKAFALTAFRELPANPTEDDIRAAIEASGAKDANRILALIGGADDPKAAYWSFRKWVEGCGDLATVLTSDHAGDSFALGAAKVFENDPKVEVSSSSVSASGTMEIVVTVKDGEEVVAVASEKVAEMFEATNDLADWKSAETKLEPHVTDKTQGVSSSVTFTVTPGDGTSEKAFLRIRK